MITEELLSYIRKEIADGSTKEQITETLTTSGWTILDIEKAFIKSGVSFKGQADTETVTTQETKADVINQLTSEIDDNEAEPSSGVETAPVDASQYNNEIEVRNSKKWVILTLVILSMSIIGAGSVYAYFSFYKKLTPYEVLTRMVKASQQVSTSKFNSDLSVNIQASSKSSGSGKVKIELKSKGSKDTTNLKDAKMDSNMNINVNASSGLFAINSELDLDMKVIDNVVYVRLNKVSDLPIPIDFSKIVGKWIKIDNAEFTKVAGQVSAKNSAANKILSNTKSNKEKTVAEMVSFVKGAKQIINRSFVSGNDEKIGGVLTYHYVIKVSPDDIKTLFDNMVSIIKSTNPDIVDITQIDKFKETDNFNKMIDMLSKIDLQMWVGKKDFLLHKVVAKLNLVNEKFVNTSYGNTKKINIVSNFAYIEPNAGIFYDDNKNKYGDNFKLGPCPKTASSNVMFVKDSDISSSIKNIKSFGGQDVSCVAVGDSAGANKYAISAVFADGSDGWCVDSSGFSGSGSANKDGECGKYIPNTNLKIAPKNFITLNGDISVVFSASDYGKPVVVTAPENSTSIEDVTKDFTAQFSTHSTQI